MVGVKMNSCEYVIFISIIASGIAKGKTEDEINILSTFFSQLGDTLATIAAIDSSCSNFDDNKVQTNKSTAIDLDNTNVN